MKRAQLIGIGVAGVCGLGAFYLMNGIVNRPREIHQDMHGSTVKVLVARSDISLGTVTGEPHFRWQEFPDSAVPQGAITCGGAACSTREYVGGIARAPMLKDEMVTKSKLVKAGEGGVLASILPAGKRAISTKITEESAVGRLILPNDHVDVILTRRVRGRSGLEEHVSELLFRNVRVLAIGQRIEVKDGQKQADGNTATLELTPYEVEKLAESKSRGEISLALRSVADFNRDAQGSVETKARSDRAQRDDTVLMLKYGVRSRTHGVN